MSLSLAMLANRRWHNNVRALFAAGEQGVWYDPSDFSTLFQDAAGSTPVTAVGQPVGRILDKSGRGNHATQSTTTSRPILQQDGSRYYLSFDGVDDSLATASINFSGTDKVSVFAGVRRDVTATGVFLELSANVNSFPGSFYLTVPEGASLSTVFRSAGSIAPAGGSSARISYTGISTPDKMVLSASADISGDLTWLRRNGVAGLDGMLDQGTGDFGNHVLYIGRRGGSSLPFSGRMCQLIVRGALTSDVARIEQFVNMKTGAY